VDNARNHTLLQTSWRKWAMRRQIKFVKAERPADWAGQPVETAPEPERPHQRRPGQKHGAGCRQPTKEKPAPAKFTRTIQERPLIQKHWRFSRADVEVRT